MTPFTVLKSIIGNGYVKIITFIVVLVVGMASIGVYKMGLIDDRVEYDAIVAHKSTTRSGTLFWVTVYVPEVDGYEATFTMDFSEWKTLAKGDQVRMSVTVTGKLPRIETKL